MVERSFAESGLNLQRQKEIIEANRPVPSLQDIITFAVRDVFEKEQVEQAKLLEGVPDVYLSECRKRGLDETDAKIIGRHIGIYRLLLKFTKCFIVFILVAVIPSHLPNRIWIFFSTWLTLLPAIGIN